MSSATKTPARLLCGAALLMCVGLAADLPARHAAAHTFVGKIEGDGAAESALIGLVTDGAKFTAYVCSRDDAFNETFSRWHKGDVRGGAMESESGGVKLRAAVSGDKVTGTLEHDGTRLSFAAESVPDGGAAGLCRAEDAEDGEKVVAGWVVASEDDVAGAVRRGQNPVQTPPAATAAQVKGNRVNAPGQAGAANQGAAANAAKGAAQRTARLTRLKPKNGSPLLEAVVTTMRRFNQGAAPRDAVEQAAFARLAKVRNKKAVADMVKRYDALPAAERATLIGSAQPRVTANQSVSSIVQKVIGDLRLPPPSPAAAPAGNLAVQSVQLRTLRCVRQQSDGLFGLGGANEVFAVYAVFNAGGVEPTGKTTGTLKSMTNGVQKDFATADQVVFPLGSLTPLPGADVVVSASLFEADDLGVLADVLDAVSTALDIAELFFKDKFKDGSLLKKVADIVGILSTFADALIPLLPSGADSLGTDVLVVKPQGATGRLVGDTGAAKTKFTFRRVAGGKEEFNYEITNVTARVQ